MEEALKAKTARSQLHKLYVKNCTWSWQEEGCLSGKDWLVSEMVTELHGEQLETIVAGDRCCFK